MSPLPVETLIARISAVGILASALEYLAQPWILRDEGLMSWEVARTRKPWLTFGPRAVILNALVAYPNVLGLLAARAFLALAVIFMPASPGLGRWLYPLTAILALVFFIRTRYGHDGADQMSMITFTSLALSQLSHGPFTHRMGLWFLTIQLCLSYLVAGIAKLSSAGWRDGTHLAGICGTHMYGNERVARLLASRPVLAKYLARGVIAWECSFSLVLVLPLPLAIALMISGVAFHLVNAGVMGLNTFVWSFVALYPALLYCIAAPTG